MATVTNERQILDDEFTTAFTCPVCLSVFETPKILPNCGHSLCLACVKAVLQSSTLKQTGGVTCPECRAENVLGPQGPDGLKTNFRLQNAAELLNDRLTKTARDAFCVVGEDCPHLIVDKRLPSVNCRHCEKSFCQFCMIAHMDRVKMSINAMASANGNYSSSICERVDVVRKQIEEAAATVHGKIDAVIDGYVARLHLAIDETIGGRLKAKVEKVQGDALAEVVLLGETVSKQQSLEKEITRINQTPLLNLAPDELPNFLESLRQYDKTVSTLSNLVLNVEAISIDRDIKAADIIVDNAVKFITSTFQIQATSTLSIGKLVWAASRLHDFAKNGNLNEIIAIFNATDLPVSEKEKLVNHRDECDLDRTALIQAAARGYLSIVRYLLLDQKADLLAKSRDDLETTAIHLAVMNGHLETTRFLVESTNGAAARFVLKNGENSLNIAASIGDLEMVQILVGTNSVPIDHQQSTFPGSIHWTPLMQASEAGHLKIVEFLTAKGAKCLAREASTGQLAIHLAASNGNTGIVQHFIEKCDRNLMREIDIFGDNVLHKASAQGHIETVDYLCTLSEKPSLDGMWTGNSLGLTPFLAAVASGQVEVVDFFIFEKKSENVIYERDKVGNSAIQIASLIGHCGLVRRFLEIDEELTWNVRPGETPLEIAKRLKHFDLYQMLVREFHDSENDDY